MSGERAALPARGTGLLRGRQTKSYGSLVRSQLSPVRHRRIEHMIQPGETLQGLALKYGVSMEQIKRANRLYTNDSIFLKKSLSIPVMSDLDGSGNQEDVAEGDSEGSVGSGAEKNQVDCRDVLSDLSPGDFLKRLDGLISQSKHAAVKGCQEAEKRVAAFEAACSSGSRASEWRPLRRSQSVISPPRMQQRNTLLAVPLTVTKLTNKLREGEDEIFEL